MIREEHAPRRRETSSSTYLVTGLIIGMIAGLIFSLAVAPLRYTDATPDILDAEGKELYQQMIVLAYDAEKDLGRAKARFGSFHYANLENDLLTLSILFRQDGGDSPEFQALEWLMYDLKQERGAANPEDAPEATPEGGEEEAEDTSLNLPTDTGQAVAATDPTSEASTPEPGETGSEDAAETEQTQPPIPTSTISAALSKPFQLEERLVLCDEDAPLLLQLEVSDEDGTELAGVPVFISWDGGSEVFYTGLFPLVSDGYADFQMLDGVRYRLQVGKSGEIFDGIQPSACKRTDGSTFAGGWSLTFHP